MNKPKARMHPPIVVEFLKFLIDVKHYSPRTADCYGSDLVQFACFLTLLAATDDCRGTAAETRILSADYEILGHFVSFLQNSNYSVATVARKVACLKSFFGWLANSGKIRLNPAAGILTVKVVRKIPQIVRTDHLMCLVRSPDDTNLSGARDRAFLEVLYSTGIRISELASLNLGSINEFDLTLTVRQISNRFQTILIDKESLKVLLHYMELRRSFVGKDGISPENHPSAPLFVNKHKTRLSERSIRRKLKEYLKKVGLDESISPSAFRHSFAARQLSLGAEPWVVQKMLGYRSLTTTARYSQQLQQLS